MQLLDGSQYKPTPMLSTGQRCTVVLPILLRHDERPLIIDQPEDHLDNAYVVETLVHAISARSSESQIIVSTHNPNVPVLGNASQVTLLGSDGRRGFQRHTGPLHDPDVVEAITSVMEGGADAFERRAAFYRRGTR
jgi:ABC-type cobalamin/Fe3+-siderophores transport system ATPase subunit